jgi:hypothetical protein
MVGTEWLRRSVLVTDQSIGIHKPETNLMTQEYLSPKKERSKIHDGERLYGFQAHRVASQSTIETTGTTTSHVACTKTGSYSIFEILSTIPFICLLLIPIAFNYSTRSSKVEFGDCMKSTPSL